MCGPQTIIEQLAALIVEQPTALLHCRQQSWAFFGEFYSFAKGSSYCQHISINFLQTNDSRSHYRIKYRGPNVHFWRLEHSAIVGVKREQDTSYGDPMALISQG